MRQAPREGVHFLPAGKAFLHSDDRVIRNLEHRSGFFVPNKPFANSSLASYTYVITAHKIKHGTTLAFREINRFLLRLRILPSIL